MWPCARADGCGWSQTAHLQLCFELGTAFQDRTPSWGQIRSCVPFPCKMPLLPWQIFLSLFAQPVQGQGEALSV